MIETNTSTVPWMFASRHEQNFACMLKITVSDEGPCLNLNEVENLHKFPHPKDFHSNEDYQYLLSLWIVAK